jgi:hypothetical protein
MVTASGRTSRLVRIAVSPRPFLDSDSSWYAGWTGDRTEPRGGLRRIRSGVHRFASVRKDLAALIVLRGAHQMT